MIKQRYEYNPADVYDFARTIGAEVKEERKGGNTELWFRYCPYCGGGGNKDQNTFSVNLSKGVFKCFRSTCGVQGHFVNLAHDFNYKLPGMETEPKAYRELPQKAINTTTEAEAYMLSRGISKEITKRYKLTTRADNDNVLVFPFYDESNVLVNVKYRYINYDKNIHKGGKEFSIGTDADGKGCKQILFGMQECSGTDRLIITEGQIDSLSLSEAGIRNAVSVPTGAQGATWINNCWDFLQRFEKVIVFGDNEHGKITLVDMLQKRISRLYVVRRDDYLGCKDANEILQKYGKESLQYAVEHAEILPIDRIKRLCDVRKVNLADLPKFKTGIYELDYALGGIYLGQLVVLTGKTGEGKSTFMSQLICEALNQGQRVLAYSGELEDYQFRAWLDSQLAGKEAMRSEKNEYGGDTWYLPENIAQIIGDWYSDRMYIYDNSIVENIDEEQETILSTIEDAIKRYSLNLVCIDNLMSAIEFNERVDFYAQQGQFATKLKKLALKYNVAIILVAHPRKVQGKNIDNDDVSGSSDITKRADVVIAFGRAADEEKLYDCEIRLIKARWSGQNVKKNDFIKCCYSEESRRITSFQHGEKKVYGWSKEINEYKLTQETHLVDITEEDNLPW